MLFNTVSTLRTPVYTLLRFFVGVLFWFHGAQKLFGLFGGKRVPLAGQLGVAGIIEFVAGICIALGLLTSYMALVAAVEMAAAYVIAHAPQGTWPIQNGGELALLYMFVFLFIMVEGGGRWALDSMWGARAQPRRVFR